ncbi:hypothetical protein [Ruminiclostridium cellobioparum]|uniref:Uncharacterized protein n=1 Tax=Ruminiclostridium cellobioparum subsp. termitidis CT1112 TaxID=1195236 RepID=S0FPU1_RUMCE|nr:hypothetical protein [Ruminiclostridium cellobioparum]EMS70513.1 hypothetical protein CTER_3813 [Ruminiclostridium cellobioparum subsp. termitidis CT1112]
MRFIITSQGPDIPLQLDISDYHIEVSDISDHSISVSDATAGCPFAALSHNLAPSYQFF